MSGSRMGYVLLMVAACLWGGAAVASKAAVTDASPMSVAFMRFAIAAVFLTALQTRDEGFDFGAFRKHWLLLTLLGLSGISVPNILFLFGVQTTTAAKAALIQAGIPVFTVALAVPLLKERLSGVQWAGIALSTAGVIGLMAGDDLAALLAQGVSVGDLLVLGAVFCWAANALIAKVAMGRFSARGASTYSAIAAAVTTVPLLIGSPFPGDLATVPVSGWLSILYLALGPSALAYIFFYGGIGRVGASVASLYLNLTPIAGVVLSWLILGEQITLAAIIAGALVIAGVMLTSMAPSPAAKPAHDEQLSVSSP